MNKIKLMYDLVKNLKEKDVFKGVLKVEGIKDQKKVISFDNTFEKNILTGQTKAKINTELDYEGKKMKMENSIDCEMQGHHGSHGFMRHIHHHGMRPGSIREGLNRAATMLSIFNSLEVEEQENRSVLLSLDINDIPEDVREEILEKMHHQHNHHKSRHHHRGEMNGKHNHHLFMKEFHSMQKTDFNIRIYINEVLEIEKIRLEVKGEKTDKENKNQDMKLTAELGLDW